MTIIRLMLMIFFIAIGLFTFGVATYGLYKFKYILNRVHVASVCDTLAPLSVLIGLMIYNGFNIFILKLFIILIFMWLTNPVSTHLVSQMEIMTNKDIDKECEVVEGEVQEE